MIEPVDYDVLVVGAGFAGSEAAYALANRGLKVGLMTQSLDTVFLPFTPIGRPFPRGSLLAEVGEEGMKGWELHSQAKYRLEAQPDIHLYQSSATRLIVEDAKVAGVETWEGPAKRAPKTVLALGSFIDPKLYIGSVAEEAGRLSEVAYPDLYQHLLELGFAFVPHEAEAPERDGTPGYRVQYKTFGPEEWDPETFRLKRIEGLYGLGLCVLGAGTYPQMAEEAMRLAAVL